MATTTASDDDDAASNDDVAAPSNDDDATRYDDDDVKYFYSELKTCKRFTQWIVEILNVSSNCIFFSALSLQLHVL